MNKDHNEKKGEQPKVPMVAKLDLVTTMGPTKAMVTFNVVEQMKKASLKISTWDAIFIPYQRDLVHMALKDINGVGETTRDCNSSTLMCLVKPLEVEKSTRISKPPPFHLSLIIGDNLVHNCMIDLGASSLVMPNNVANHLGIKYEPVTKGVVELDGTTI